MNTKFSIGEVSKIFNITVHSLRHYHKIGLIVPSYVDESSGYRYYTFEQFQYLSRFKYFRSLGLSLEQIKQVFETGKKQDLQAILKEIREEKHKELKDIQEMVERIDFITDYYSFNEDNDLLNLIYKKSFDERFLFISDRGKNTIEEMDVSLHRKLYSRKYRDINFMRQFGYILDFEELKKSNFKPHCTSVTLKEAHQVTEKDLVILPKGEYVCFCTRILNENFDISPLIQYIEKRKQQTPKFVLALEFEDHLHEYYNALYEIQLYYEKKL